jgi:hypothetical protein
MGKPVPRFFLQIEQSIISISAEDIRDGYQFREGDSAIFRERLPNHFRTKKETSALLLAIAIIHERRRISRPKSFSCFLVTGTRPRKSF